MKRTAVNILLFLFSIIPFVLAMLMPELFAGWYPRLAGAVSHTLSKMSGIVPFAISELMLYALAAALPVYIIVSIVRRAKAGRVIGTLLTWAGAMLFSFVWLYGLVYFCPTPSARMGLTAQNPTPEELIETAEYYRDILNAAEVNRDEQGRIRSMPLESYNSAVISGYNRLAERYSFITPDPMPAKALVFGIVQSYLGISGVYLPWLAESCVNTDTPPQNLPATVAHELAHRQGAAPEDEANFLGILACLNSDDPHVIYSGAFLAFTYLSNELNVVDPGEQAKLWEGLKPGVIVDLVGVREHYAQYEGPVNDMGEALNDTYLKAMQQEEGTRSYSRVVILLIAEHMAKK